MKRAILVALAAGALCLVVAAVLGRHDLLERYYVSQITRDEGRFDELLREGGDVKRRALKRYLRTAATEEFWRLIESSRKESSGDMEAQMALIHDLLLRVSLKSSRGKASLTMEEKLAHVRGSFKRPAEKVAMLQCAFELVLQQGYTSDLWGAAYAINGGCSDDSFADFRCWLILHGRETWQQAVAGPDGYLSKLVSRDQAKNVSTLRDAAEFYMLFLDAYRELTDGDFPETYDDLVPVNPELVFEWVDATAPRPYPVVREKLRERYPRLFDKFYKPLWMTGRDSR